MAQRVAFRTPAVRILQRVDPRLVLLVAAAGTFMEFVDTTLVNIAFPEIRQAFPAAATSTLAWVFNAYSIVFAAFLVTGGRVTDLLGRRRLFRFGLMLFTAGSLCCALAPSIGLLIAARVLQAFGAAFVVPAATGLVIEAFPAERRAGALGALAASAAVAAALGPPIGGLLIRLVDWRFAFLVNVPVGVAALAAGSRVLVESRAPGRRALPDLLGALALAAALGLLTLGIVEGETWGWGSPAQLGVFAGAVLFAGWFGYRSSWHRAPALDLLLFRTRAFAVSAAALVVTAVGFYAFYLANVLFLITAWGYSTLQAGLALTPGAAAAALSAGIGGHIAERRGFRVLVSTGALVGVGAMLYYRFAVGVHPAFLSQWLPGQLISGVGSGLTQPMLNGAGLNSAPRARAAAAGAVLSAARQVGAAVGVAIAVVIVLPPTPVAVRSVWTMAAGCFAGAAVLGLVLGHVRPAADEDALPTPTYEVPEIAAADGAYATPGREPAGLQATPSMAADDPFAGAALFAGLSDDLRVRIIARLESVRLHAGDWLFHQGDIVDGLYLVRAGRLEVVGENRDMGRLRLLRRGDIAGELALLTKAPRSASVRAVRDSEVARLGQEDFAALLGDAPEFAAALLTQVAIQMQATGGSPGFRSRPAAATVAVIGLDAGAPLARGAEMLLADLRVAGSVDLVDTTTAFDAGSALSALDAAERAHDRVILISSLSTSPPGAVDFCLRQADRTILIGWAELPPADLRTASVFRARELLLGPTAKLAEWRNAIQPHSTRRAEDDNWTALHAFGRRACGRSVGLVLSGGGARTLAHIGVVAELRAAGITPDRVGATGAGSFVAAMVACGWDADDMQSLCHRELVRRNPFGDYTLSRSRLIRGDRLRAMLDRVFDDVLIEELPLIFFCVSADLATGERVIFDRGPLADALQAAMCIPGLMAPIPRDGRLLIDGGVLDDLPVATMAAGEEGPIVAVDVSAAGRLPALIETSRRTPRNRQEVRLPSARETLGRAIVLGGTAAVAAARDQAAVTIVPDVDGIGMLEFHQLDVAVAAGRRAARQALSGGVFSEKR